MKKLTFEFDVPGTVTIDGKKLRAELGNAVALVSDVPDEIKPVHILAAKLNLVLTIEESTDAQPEPTSVERVHEAPTDGGQQER